MLHALVAAAEEGATKNPLIPELYDIFWSAVCFVILLALFWKIVLPKMQVMLDERSAAIEGSTSMFGTVIPRRRCHYLRGACRAKA